ncbi:hypothetical protein EBU71_18100, partial [bacterium]|nr:hypothetical protein [Candidatus Elulimicrobium humile]
MTYLGDTLTVGLVLVLLFGSIALYLYTRIQQSEQKISLLESILLELKMASEVQSYTELPALEPSHSHSQRPKSPLPPVSPVESTSNYTPFNDSQEENHLESHTLTLETIPESDSSDSHSSRSSDTPNDSVQLEVLDEVDEVSEYKSAVADVFNPSSPKESV